MIFYRIIIVKCLKITYLGLELGDVGRKMNKDAYLTG